MDIMELIDPTCVCAWSPDDEDACMFCNGEACGPCAGGVRSLMGPPCDHGSAERHEGVAVGLGEGLDAGVAVGTQAPVPSWADPADDWRHDRELVSSLLDQGWRPFRTDAGDVLVSPALNGERGHLRHLRFGCGDGPERVITVGPALHAGVVGSDGRWEARFGAGTPGAAVLAVAETVGKSRWALTAGPVGR